MFSFTVLLLSSVVLCTAQLNTGPQTFTEQQQDNGKRIVTQDYTYIIAPLRINAQKENVARAPIQETQEKAFLRYINSLPQSQGQNRENSRPVPNENEESVYRKIEELVNSGRLINSFLEQKPVEQEQVVDVIPETDKTQDGERLSEELQRQLNRILGNNQIDLKSLSADSGDQLVNVAQSEAESSNNEEQKSGDIENSFQYILRNHGIDLEKENFFASEDSNFQNKPSLNQQQEKPVVDQEILKALSAIAEEDQVLNVESEQQSQANLKEEEASVVRKAVEDILRKRNNFGRQNRFGSKQSNYEYSPVIVLKNNLERAKAPERSNINQEQRDSEIRKLIEDVLRRRDNNAGKQADSQSEENKPSNNQQVQEQILNRIHLKALSTISEGQLLKEFSPFGKRL